MMPWTKSRPRRARMKQVLIKLEHATQDVQAVGHKIGEQNRQIAELEAKLDTKDRLLDEALQKIKGIHDDSTEKTEPEEISTEEDE
jgi:tRNA/tmRNA/rRNA uracil-C5-methylase (TrmA/RlmC/RlmD family)